MVPFTSRGLLEKWFRPFTVGGYLGCLQADVNDRESQSRSFRPNQGNFMVLQISAVWPVDSLWPRTYVKVMSLTE